MSDTNTTAQPWLSDKAYAFLKFLALVALPAIATLYASLAQIWHIGFGNEVVLTVVAIDTFMGIVLGISSAQYNAANAGGPPADGTLHVVQNGDGTGTVGLNMVRHPDDLVEGDKVTFVVNAMPPSVDDAAPGVVPNVPPTA